MTWKITMTSLYNLLGYSFLNTDLLNAALTHPSYLHEYPHVTASYQRLEFLGDAVLSLIVSEALFKRYSDVNEGALSKMRSFAVNHKTLLPIAQHLQLGQYAFLGQGEKDHLSDERSFLTDVLEAILGAIYLDGGFIAAQSAWNRWQEEMGLDLLDIKNLDQFDAKSRLQERCLKIWKCLPFYDASEIILPSGEHVFRVTLKIGEYDALSIQNVSKKKAQQELAFYCLKYQPHLMLQGDTHVT